ncbi:MAG: succinylglutamate desuccinylase/aspartoacylase family protein [Deltaproteobacteria bacterium]|nr:succinylglutamate desuccinylase/aspartoacylase family protein [Deltaproteobacteria bacterium]
MNPRMSPVKKYFYEYIVILSLLIAVFPQVVCAQNEHTVYFQNTAYELNIYRIYGSEPGKTLMLIGGIQGNEPGGFLSADSYADMKLKKGNLIVVPRANFYSIIMNERGPNGDMNRKFTHEDSTRSMEDKIVNILKKLISESDYLLNLHDGSGYYHPTYISKWRNPDRFGQSIIADCETFNVPEKNKVIPLKDIVQKVLDKVNPHISNDLYKFHFMNTRTSATDSSHKEQRKSATYYALTVHHIPAFGVETSKFLPTIDLKVLFHNLVINAFMEEFDIVPHSPGFTLDTPALKYVVVSVNNEIPIVIKKGESLNISSGDTVNVSHVESNYERGLSLDILNFGDLNDYRRDIKIDKDTVMIVRKDNEKFGEIPIKLGEKPVFQSYRSSAVITPEKIEYFSMELNGREVLFPEGGKCDVVKGDIIKIVDVFPRSLRTCTVNFKGFVGDRINNTGEDRGFDIDTGDLLERYSTDDKGNNYQVVVTKDEKEIGVLNISLAKPEMDYMVLKIDDNRHVMLRPNESVTLSPENNIRLEAVETNLFNNDGVHLEINGHKFSLGEAEVAGELCRPRRNDVNIRKGKLLIAKIIVNLGGPENN